MSFHRQLAYAVLAIALLAAGCSSDGPAAGSVSQVATPPAAGLSTPPGGSDTTPTTENSQPGMKAGAEMAPAPIEEAGETASIGFNNAAQVVTSSDGTQHFVYISERASVWHYSPGSGATLISDSRGRKSLTSIAAADGLLVVAWSQGPETIQTSESVDGGATWKVGGPFAGNGISLAADGGTVVATWHDGDESSARVMFSRRDPESGAWSTPTRIDKSDAGPVWSSVAVSGSSIYVTWRDNRDGPYRVYFRFSNDGGTTWQPEQVIGGDQTGDPTVCAGDNGIVWLAHHGGGKVTVTRSTDGGATWGERRVVGDGWFPRISCDSAGNMVLGWEQAVGLSARQNDKSAAYTTALSNGAIAEPTTLDKSAGTTASVTIREDGYADALWVRDTAATDQPLEGELWRAVVPIR